jgi:hypothetical protein
VPRCRARVPVHEQPASYSTIRPGVRVTREQQQRKGVRTHTHDVTDARSRVCTAAAARPQVEFAADFSVTYYGTYKVRVVPG